MHRHGRSARSRLRALPQVVVPFSSGSKSNTKISKLAEETHDVFGQVTGAFVLEPRSAMIHGLWEPGLPLFLSYQKPTSDASIASTFFDS